MFRPLIALLFVMTGLVSLPASASQAPEVVVQQAVDGLLGELSQIPPEARDQAVLKKLVNQYLVPAIDQDRIARSSLGKFWKRIKKTHQEQFIEVFLDKQIRAYSGVFKAFDGQKIDFAGFEPHPNRDGVGEVKSSIKLGNGSDISINFRVYDAGEQGWLIYDVVIAGVSEVLKYRAELGDTFEGATPSNIAERMEGLLDRLRTEGAAEDAAADAEA